MKEMSKKNEWILINEEGKKEEREREKKEKTENRRQNGEVVWELGGKYRR